MFVSPKKEVKSRRTLVAHWNNNEILVDGVSDVVADIKGLLEEATKQFMTGVKRGGRRKVYLDVKVLQYESRLEPSVLNLQIVIKRNKNYSDYEFM